MSIELKQAAQQVLDAFEAFGEADDFATLFTLTQKVNALRTAIQQAESGPVKAAPYNPTEEMRWAMKRIDPALSSEQCRALWSAAWSASPSTHPSPGVPEDVARDAISTVREQYRGTDWGKAAECVCDAIDAAMTAAQEPS